jgi:single-stranded-DNA-specific exonuclease
MNDTVWIQPLLHNDTRILAEELGIPVNIAQILVNRHITDPDEAHTFLFGTLDDMYDPFLMKGMQKAVDRIKKAVASREKILIFGDYDVDGVLSVVILSRALQTLGAEVDYFIPDRLRDGYGIKNEYIPIVQERKAKLVVSVDCGIKAFDFVEKAKEVGVDVIITDHHQPGPTLPKAVAVLNPAVEDSGYPDKHLAGIGVAFKLIQALFKNEGRETYLRHYLKMVAIGTVADIARLKNENRLFVKFGLESLKEVSNIGLKCLLEVCGLTGKNISAGDVGFRIGPRINAPGRLGRADLCVKLFFSESDQESKELALQLNALNVERQEVEKSIFKDAVSRVESKTLHERYKILIMGCENWHRGVIGIVASKLKEYFYRPVLLFTYKNNKAYGSGRSIKDFSLIDCLEEHKQYFLNYGGHPMAVGCELTLDKVKVFRNEMNKFSRIKLQKELLTRKIHIDAKLDFHKIDKVFLDHLSLLAPHGAGNARPVFLSEDVELVADPKKLQRKHCKMLVRQNGRIFEALGWGKADWADSFKKGDRLNIVYSLQFSQYLGEEKMNFSLEDIKPYHRS